jgi:mRNA interferase RelE/StbE
LDLKSEIKQLHDEVRLMRRDIEEIKMMLVQEVAPTEGEERAIEAGRKEFAKDDFEEWKDVRKRAVS